MFQIRQVESNQTDVHPRLSEVVRRHLQHAYRRPPAEHTREAFARLDPPAGVPWLLDGGCGNGESSVRLAQAFPEAWVLGVDRSAARLEQGQRLHEPLPPNLCLLRADLVDLVLMARDAGWRCATLYLLYPNPWPKAEHLQRRWHGHAVFPLLLQLADQLELRSNWELYLQEFALALELTGRPRPEIESWQPQQPVSAFERKYLLAGQPLYRLRSDLNDKEQIAKADLQNTRDRQVS
ncbi:MAG: tRNA (guanosine(46)-N(7))-methyltransferase TrmB [Candidatus Sericytochromatia bacterium]